MKSAIKTSDLVSILNKRSAELRELAGTVQFSGMKLFMIDVDETGKLTEEGIEKLKLYQKYKRAQDRRANNRPETQAGDV